jgi:Flp pilus assembly protein protease CpaA
MISAGSDSKTGTSQSLRQVLVMFWRHLCAIQDRRTRYVSNWLTAPLFFLAWPVALLMRNFPLTLATIIGVYVTYRAGAGMGAADGELALGLTGIAPWVFVVGAMPVTK